MALPFLGILRELARAKIENWCGPVFPDNGFSMLTAQKKKLQHLLPESAPNFHLQWTSPHFLCHFAALSLKEKIVIITTREMLTCVLCVSSNKGICFASDIGNNKPYPKVTTDSTFLISVSQFHV